MKARRVVAPDLVDALAYGDDVWIDLFGDRGARVRKQALAAMAVARAADRWNRGAPNGVLHLRVDAALARLQKVSAP